MCIYGKKTWIWYYILTQNLKIYVYGLSFTYMMFNLLISIWCGISSYTCILTNSSSSVSLSHDSLPSKEKSFLFMSISWWPLELNHYCSGLPSCCFQHVILPCVVAMLTTHFLTFMHGLACHNYFYYKRSHVHRSIKVNLLI